MESLRRIHFAVALGSVIVFLCLGGAREVLSATLRSQEEALKIVAIENVSIKNGEVSGTVINRSNNALRDVQLQIRYSWRWKNEFKPKEDTVGETVLHKVEKEIPPGGKAPFTYKQSLPERGDGHYEITVKVAGFTEVIR